MARQVCLFCGGDTSALSHGVECGGYHEAHYPEVAGWKEPTTSREAAETVEVSLLQRAVCGCLDAHGAMTADECAAQLGLSILAIRPRFSELRALGLILDTGERHLNRSGKRAAVWTLQLTGTDSFE